MMLKSFPYVIKQHGSLKYLKCVISTFRYNGGNSKHPTKFIAAAPSISAVSVSKEIQIKNSSCTKVKAVEEDNISELSSRSTETDYKNPENIIQQYLKPISEPDYTNVRKNFNNKTSVQETVKLLNVIKPADLEWHKQVIEVQSLPKYYKSLSKFRLTGLVVLTTLAGYGMAPGAVEANAILFMILGTGLTSAAANSFNQILEVPYDSQMARTKNRVLTRGLLTPLHAFTFATCSATLGLSALYFGTNALTAVLGATNLLLYTSVYTPLKRCNITNTWLGSVVGAIPPLMGWVACSGSIDSGGLLLGAILYAWQFPHFNALSWNLRSDYSKAGYRMTSVVDPDLCRRTALRYSIVMLGLCTAAPVMDLTTWTFAFDSIPLNCYLIYCAWQFYKKGDSASSRKLFRLSLIYLPVLMLLMFIGKKYSPNSTNEKNVIKKEL